MAADEFLWGAAALLGLVVGSFLNVVIHRLPRMLEAQWAEASHEQAPDNPPPLPATKPYNIAVPGSHCPHCSHVLPWAEKMRRPGAPDPQLEQFIARLKGGG